MSVSGIFQKFCKDQGLSAETQAFWLWLMLEHSDPNKLDPEELAVLLPKFRKVMESYDNFQAEPKTPTGWPTPSAPGLSRDR